MSSHPCATVAPEPFAQAFRSNELWARMQGAYEQADYYRQAADRIESGFLQWAPRTFSGLRLATMAGWRLDLPEPCTGAPLELSGCGS